MGRKNRLPRNSEACISKRGLWSSTSSSFNGSSKITTARLSLDDLSITRRYFELSYEYAKKIKGFDTFQIDNHYCRLLLREAEDATEAEEAFKIVNEALTTLKKQVLRENRHYPYRSAWSIEGVAKRHSTKWTDEQKKVVIGNRSAPPCLFLGARPSWPQFWRAGCPRSQGGLNGYSYSCL